VGAALSALRPKTRVLLRPARLARRDTVSRVGSFRVSVGDTTRQVRNFRDARSVIAEAMTGLMARDPESVARDAMSLNQAFESGAAEHSLTAHGRWSTTVTVHGKPVSLLIVKRRWRWVGTFFFAALVLLLPVRVSRRAAFRCLLLRRGK
jgi:hypothetical protein